MLTDYKITKERINECIKNKSGRLILSNLKINKLPKLIKKCKDHLLYLNVNYTKITHISFSLYKLQKISFNYTRIIHYPISFNTLCVSTYNNPINNVEYYLCMYNIWKHSFRHFIRIIITIKYIQQLYRKYLFYIDFYSVY